MDKHSSVQQFHKSYVITSVVQKFYLVKPCLITGRQVGRWAGQAGRWVGWQAGKQNMDKF